VTVLGTEGGAVEKKPADVVRLLLVGRRLFFEPLLELAAFGPRETRRKARRLLECTDSRPECTLELVALLAYKALEGERVSDVAAEVLEYPGCDSVSTPSQIGQTISLGLP
jgi:hypothetical protein